MLKFEGMRFGGLTCEQEVMSGPNSNCLLDGSGLTEGVKWCQGGKDALLLWRSFHYL